MKLKGTTTHYIPIWNTNYLLVFSNFVWINNLLKLRMFLPENVWNFIMISWLIYQDNHDQP